jgi:O-antigen ligase
VYSAHPADSIPARLLTLPKRQQILLGIGAVVLLIVPVMLMEGSLIIYAAMILGITYYLCLRHPATSVVSFILFNVITTLLARSSVGGSAEGQITTSGILLGSGILSLLTYWLVRIRLMESEQFGKSLPLLLFMLFWVWAIIVTCIGFLRGNNPTEALREFLNLSPLLFLPILYHKYIGNDSESERSIFIGVLMIAVFTIFLNISRVRSAIIEAAVVENVGGSHSDESLPCLMILISVSFLMYVRRFRYLLLSSSLLLLGLLGLIVTFRRSLYIATIVALLPLFILGNNTEKKRGILNFSIICMLAGTALALLSNSVRLVRILLINYGLRFLSSQHLGTDLALRDRYAEWRETWSAITQSPIIGYGFGAQLRHFSVIVKIHRFQAFTHDSYLYFLFKTGFVGATLFFGVFLLFLFKGLRLARSAQIGEFHRAIIRASTAFLIVLLIGSYTDTYLEHRPALVWTGLIWGYFLALEQKFQKNNDNNDAMLLTKDIVEMPIAQKIT